jgi:hypothetical protein
MRTPPKQNFRTPTRLQFGMLWLCVALFVATPSGAQESRSPGWVVIPVAEYRTLHSKAYPAEPEPETSPLQATLTRIDYDMHIGGDLAKGHVNLTVDVLKDGWVSVPIPSGLRTRSPIGQQASAHAGSCKQKRRPSGALLSHPGRSVLSLISPCRYIGGGNGKYLVAFRRFGGDARISGTSPTRRGHPGWRRTSVGEIRSGGRQQVGRLWPWK